LPQLNHLPWANLQLPPPCNATVCPLYLLPDGAVDFHAVGYASGTVTLSYTFSVNDEKLRSYHRANFFTMLPSGLSQYLYKLNALFVEPARMSFMELIMRGAAGVACVCLCVGVGGGGLRTVRAQRSPHAFAARCRNDRPCCFRC
jgi:hypothetical protein